MISNVFRFWLMRETKQPTVRDYLVREKELIEEHIEEKYTKYRFAQREVERYCSRSNILKMNSLMHSIDEDIIRIKEINKEIAEYDKEQKEREKQERQKELLQPKKKMIKSDNIWDGWDKIDYKEKKDGA